MSRINDVNQIGRAMKGMAVMLHPDTSPAPGNLSSLRTSLYARSNARILYDQFSTPSKIYFFKAMSLNGYSNSDIALALTESNNAGQVGNGLRRLADINASAFTTTAFFSSDVKQKLNDLIAVQRRATGTTTRRARTSTIAPTRTTTTRTTTPRAASSRAEGLVRDVPFTNTIGIEVEFFGPSWTEVRDALRKKGLSCEIEGYNHQTRRYWKIVTDVSVQGPNRGEVVSPVLKGKQGLVELRKALMAFQEVGMKVNQSAGLHVHFGASGFTLKQWKNVILNYAGFETIIDQMMQPSRRRNENFYARSLNKISNLKEKVENATTFRELQNNVFRNLRYLYINLEAYDRHGTIEFRQHASNIEVDSVINWVLFLHYLIEVSKRRVLSRFTFDNLENFTPKPLSSWIHNRIYDLSNKSYTYNYNQDRDNS